MAFDIDVKFEEAFGVTFLLRMFFSFFFSLRWQEPMSRSLQLPC